MHINIIHVFYLSNYISINDPLMKYFVNMFIIKLIQIDLKRTETQ